MDIKTILSISEARKKIFEIAEKVQKPAVYFTLTERGKPKAVVLSADEFESWQETLEVLRTFPKLEKDIEEAEEEYKSRNCLSLEDVLAKEGFVLSEKSKKPKK